MGVFDWSFTGMGAVISILKTCAQAFPLISVDQAHSLKHHEKVSIKYRLKL
jgi:hypothetical protein